MLAELGQSTIVIAILLAIYAAGASLYGARRSQLRWVESARNATILIFPLTLAACVILVVALLTNDFSIEYVWSTTSIETPTYLKISALWGSQAGSLLFWNMLLALFTAVAVWRKWDSDRPLISYAIFTASLTQIFFLTLVVALENPFTTLDVVPADGRGLNPLLRHPGMIIHPPMLYLGFVGLTIPFAFAISALITKQLDDVWIRTTRRWTLVAWLFLSLGLILGGRWAYDVLGWGGYWAWDPVENASLMPWLAGTAFLHSVMIQEKRGMFKGWNMILIILTYLLMIYGTFIVRTGIISSVHSFAQSSIGYYFFAFVAVMILFSVGLVVWRWNDLQTDNHVRSMLSRESAFLFNNFVILSILAVTFLGTNFPIVSEIVTGEQITVGEPFYEQVNGPLFAVLLVLMGIAPLTMWYRTSAKRLGMAMRWPALAALVFVMVLFAFGIRGWGALVGFWVTSFALILTILEFYKGTRARMKRGETFFAAFSSLMGRNRRRYGGYWIHLGVIIMGFGIIGSEMFQQQRQILLQRGESTTMGDFRAVFNGARQFPGPDDLLITEATLDLYKDDRLVKTLTPRNELYLRTNQPMTIPDLRATVTEDFYVLMINWEGMSSNEATFRFYINPLINWVWAGAFIFMFGTMLAAWPDPSEERIMEAARRKAPAVAFS